MRARVPLVAGGRLDIGDLWGEVPLMKRIERSSELGSHAYVPVIIRATAIERESGAGERHALALCGFAELLDHVQLSRPAKGIVIGKDGAQQDVDLDAFRPRYQELRRRMRRVLAGIESTQPGSKGECRMCAWCLHCHDQLVASDDVTLVPSIGESERRRRRAWSLERVVSELRQLHAGGETISYAGLRAAGFGALVTAAERYVGSFSRAVKLAGIAPARPLWTRERVRAEIKRLHRDGVELSCEQLGKTGHAGLVGAARKYFDSWPNAVVAAGAPPFKRGRWKTWAEIRDRLHELHRGGARMTRAALSADDHADLVAAACAEAGSWNAALKKARIPVVQEHRAWSAKQVLDGVRALHRAGVALNANLAIARGDRKLVKAATQYFGTWQEACRQAVQEYEPLLERWTIARVLEEIRDRYRAGHSVRATDVAKQAPSLTAAARRLGVRWRDACRRAGVPRSAIAPRQPPTRIRWNEERIFAELERAVRGGRALITRSFPGGFVGAVLRRYGSWPDAMEAAGWARQYAHDRAAALANRLGGATVRSKRGA